MSEGYSYDEAKTRIKEVVRLRWYSIHPNYNLSELVHLLTQKQQT